MADLSILLPNKEQVAEVSAKCDQIIDLLLANLDITNYAMIQTIVRAELADKVFSIGDQITVSKSSSLKVQIGESTGITAATAEQSTFISKAGAAAGEYTFTYNGTLWLYGGESVTLSDYGITVTGTAAADDTVIVTQIASEFVFDIVDIDHEQLVDTDYTHSLSLQLHSCLSVNFNFDSSEALIYVDPDVFPDGLPAGNYAIRAYYSDNSASTATDGYYYFTTTVDIPAGGQIRHSVLGTKTSVDDVVAGTFSTYDGGANNTALESVATGYADPDEVSVSDGVMTYDGTEYTYLGMATLQAYSRRTISGDENDGDDRSYINYIRRNNYGCNAYDVSNIRQWLNSDKAAGEWFEPQTGFDRCSATYQNYDGFLYGLDPEFVAVLGKAYKTTAIPSCDNAGSVGTRTSEELIYLPSRTEIYGGNNSIAEGSAFAYYSMFSDLTAAGTGNDTNRIKYKGTSAASWWERSAVAGNSNTVYYVNLSGYAGSSSSANSTGVSLAPACTIR